MNVDVFQGIPSAFGWVVSRRRVARNWTEERLAAAAGLSCADDVMQLESGARDPTVTELFRIVTALDDSPAIFFTDVVATWRANLTQDTSQKSRLSDFKRLYRLGYHDESREFREGEAHYDSIDDLVSAARMLNASRHEQELGAFDTVCIYVRMGSIRFTSRSGSDSHIAAR